MLTFRNPFDFFFLDRYYNRQYTNEQTFSKVFTLFAVFAIFVACLGLFGLSSFSALQKTKEIGIRKVLGARINQIIFLRTKEFLLLILIANLIAWPVIYFTMKDWLKNFANRIDISLLIFVFAGMALLLIALLTVGYKTVIAARSNPANALRYE